jgi:hypothetical protein
VGGRCASRLRQWRDELTVPVNRGVAVAPRRRALSIVVAGAFFDGAVVPMIDC